MIKLVEIASFPDGTQKKTENEFSSRYALERAFKKRPLPFVVMKELRLCDEARVRLPWKHPETGDIHQVNIVIKIEDIRKV